MTKPYSKSRSHRKFRKIIRNAAQKWNKFISEIIITSPIGLAPRELEEVFPVAHYDISVTGEWDAEELKLTASSIIEWVKKLSNNVKLIAYVHGGYQQAFELAMRKADIEESQLTRRRNITEFFGGAFDQSESQPEFRKIILEKQHKKHKGC